MKKALSLLLVAALSISVLAGCGKKNPQPPAGGGSQSTSAGGSQTKIGRAHV